MAASLFFQTDGSLKIFQIWVDPWLVRIGALRLYAYDHSVRIDRGNGISREPAVEVEGVDRPLDVVVSNGRCIRGFQRAGILRIHTRRGECGRIQHRVPRKPRRNLSCHGSESYDREQAVRDWMRQWRTPFRHHAESS